THPLGGADRVLQKTPTSFDISVWELFWPLTVGARLVLAAPGGHREPSYLWRVIDAERVTVVHFVPSMLQPFLEAGEEGDGGSLRFVICSGEALSTELERRFFARFGGDGPSLENLYGPTEAAVEVTAWRCEPAGRASRATVPIGRPVGNTAIHLLDPGLRPVPVGVAGELHIGGVQVARGYLGRPELTAERFVPDPFAAAGARLYRTGDLARFLADGRVEFLGRIDQQVKVRGFRIELGEIEAALRAQRGVAEAAVLARESASGDLHLVAYVVASASAGESAAPERLKAGLRSTLPEFMVPSSFVELSALPLTPSGKLDRRALPAPQHLHEDGWAVFVAPRGATEELVAEIWGALLDQPRIGAQDDFFALGGHSLLATRV
ncbi:MAG: non-ribosomal peptide synthetase, partial [Geodermatophilales bacterium]|nr:non-ribosomal peptide synthetase [Geodermatophilales bacterium]